jgi:hypothetical protein
MVEIEWVDMMNLHLEFNEALKTLKIFRFPSYCRILCSAKEAPTNQRSILNR